MQAKLPPERLVLGGRSMGGRYCSLVAADEEDPVAVRSGCCCSATRCTPRASPRSCASSTSRGSRCPSRSSSGTRDALGSQAGLVDAAATVPGPVTFHWLETADHGFRPLKASGLSIDDVLADVAAFSVDWVRALPG